MRDLVAGLDAWPAYYAQMAPANAAGPAAPDLSPPAEVDPAELRTRLEAGRVGGRPAAPDGRSPPATSSAPSTSAWRARSPRTSAGCSTPGTPLTLLGDTAEDVAEAQRELVRIGVERPAGQATGKPESWTTEPLGSYPTRHVRRPRRRPAPPRGRRARRTAPARARRRADRRRGQHPAARARRPGRRGACRLRSGCTAPRGYRASVAVSLLRALAPYAQRTPGRDRRHLRQRPRDRAADPARLTRFGIVPDVRAPRHADQGPERQGLSRSGDRGCRHRVGVHPPPAVVVPGVEERLRGRAAGVVQPPLRLRRQPEVRRAHAAGLHEDRP